MTNTVYLTTFSVNPKINSILRTLTALYGRNGLWNAVAKYVVSDSGKTLSDIEIWELYQATKFAIHFEE